ncbi:MAG TPA: thioredoxin [Firmicutes bacterium]|mgnify:FL=1|nr:thioredoxin [Bacillota bacterium]
MLKHIENTNEFLEATKGKKALVDFFAVWCGPCNALGPILEKIASEHEGIDIIKVDVDKAPEIAAKYGIQSIPTLILFEDGKAIDMRVGYLPEDSLLRFAKLK